MIDVLKYENNFKKIENIPSKLLYGNLIDNPDFTITIPIYGCNKYFGELLKNLKEQESCSLRIQIIISDNRVYKNNDNIEVVELLEKFKFVNLAYFLAEKELGQLNNFNRCIELSQSDYVAMVHDDDLLVKNYFKIVARVLPYLRKYKKIGMLHEGYQTFHDVSELKIEQNMPNEVSVHTIGKFNMTHFGFTLTGIPSCGIIFNRRIFLECGGFNDLYPSSGDAFLAGMMVNNGYKIKKFASLTGYYRIANNASLRLELCKGFIIEDELFRETWQSCGSLFRRLYMKLFSKFLYSINIDGKVRNFSPYNSEINIENLDFKKQYKKYNGFSFVKFLYQVNAKLLTIKNKISTKKFVIEK